MGGLPERPDFEPFTTRFAPATVPRSAGEWQEALRSALGQAVRRQLMADVPLGSLLSGGVDSTVLTHLMQQGLAEAPQAFAIRFAGSDEGDQVVPARRSPAPLP